MAGVFMDDISHNSYVSHFFRNLTRAMSWEHRTTLRRMYYLKDKKDQCRAGRGASTIFPQTFRPAVYFNLNPSPYHLAGKLVTFGQLE